MKCIKKMAEYLSAKTGAGICRSFIAVCMLTLGIAGCIIACVLHALPFFAAVGLVKLVIICGGYGAFLFGMLGGGVYLLIKEPFLTD